MLNTLSPAIKRRVAAIMLPGIIGGVALFLIEVAFAYTLQAFLSALGILPVAAISLPAWIPRSSKVALVALVVLGLGRAAMVALQFYWQGAAQEDVRYLFRQRIAAVLYQGDSPSTGEVMDQFMVRAEAAGFVASCAQVLGIQATASLLIMVQLFRLAPLLTVILGASLMTLLPIVRAVDARSRRTGAEITSEVSAMSHRIGVSIKNFLLLRIYGTTDKEHQWMDQALARHRDHWHRHYLLAGLKIAAPQALGLALITAVAYWAHGRLGLGSGVLVSYFYLFLRMVQNLSTMGQAASGAVIQWPSAKGLWDRLREARPTARRTRGSAPADPFQMPLGWSLRGVRFGFQEASAVLDDLDLEISPGTALVITGPSGCGKTTLLNLLLGTLAPTKGEVFLRTGPDTIPLATIRDRLMASVGYVGPESFLIEGSIHDNLVYGLTNPPSESAINAALRDAECGFIEQFDNGLEHRLTEQGQGLSAGQKQRLALARALLRKPMVLVLDEATANLDVATEKKLVATLSRLKGKMTILAATHREAIIPLADLQLNLARESSSVDDGVTTR